jgi:hypothetical protein
MGLEEQFFKENRKSGKETKACQGGGSDKQPSIARSHTIVANDC